MDNKFLTATFDLPSLRGCFFGCFFFLSLLAGTTLKATPTLLGLVGLPWTYVLAFSAVVGGAGNGGETDSVRTNSKLLFLESYLRLSQLIKPPQSFPIALRWGI